MGERRVVIKDREFPWADVTIRRVWLSVELDNNWTVGEQGITKIEHMELTGQMAFVPWLSVWRGDQLVCIVNVAMVDQIDFAYGSEDEHE